MRRIADDHGEITGSEADTGAEGEGQEHDGELAADQRYLAEQQRHLVPGYQGDEHVGALAHGAPKALLRALVVASGDDVHTGALQPADDGVLGIAQHPQSVVKDDRQHQRHDEAGGIHRPQQAVVGDEAGGHHGDLDDDGRKAPQDVVGGVGDAAHGVGHAAVRLARGLHIRRRDARRLRERQLDALAEIGLVEHLVAQDDVGPRHRRGEETGPQKEPHDVAHIFAAQAVDKETQQAHGCEGRQLLQHRDRQNGQGIAAIEPDQPTHSPGELPIPIGAPEDVQARNDPSRPPRHPPERSPHDASQEERHRRTRRERGRTAQTSA